MTNTTTLTLRNEYGEYTVQVNQRELTIAEIIDDLVIPVLLAAGYSREVIDSCLAED